jgi:hypothetical protein
MRTVSRLALAGSLALAGLTAVSAPANADWYFPVMPGVCTDPHSGYWVAPGALATFDGVLMVCSDEHTWVPV